MEDVFVIIIFVTMVGIGYFLGTTSESYSNKEELNSVGIERIAHCSNAHSNWNEIVWIKEVK